MDSVDSLEPSSMNNIISSNTLQYLCDELYEPRNIISFTTVF